MSDFLNLNQEFRWRACENLPRGTETEFLVQGTVSASFVQLFLSPVFRSYYNYLLCLKNQALQADLPRWTWRQIHPFIGKKAIYLVIVNSNYLFLDDINLQIFFLSSLL